MADRGTPENREDRSGDRGQRDSPERGASRTAAMLAGLFFLLGLGYVVGQAAAYALFVERFGAEGVPYAFLLMPVLGGVVTALTLRAARRIDLGRLLLAEVLVMLVVAVAMRVELAAGGGAVVVFLLPVWDAGVNGLNSVVVWSAASRCFNVGESKRYGPLISAGRSTSLVAGGTLIPVLVRALGPNSLYLVQAVVMSGALVVLAAFVVSHRPALGATASWPATATTDHRTSGRLDEQRAKRTDHRYLGLAFGVVFCSMLGYTLVRNIFFNRGAVRYPDPSDYAAQLGLAHAAQGLATLLIAVFGARRMFRRFGLRGSMLAVPVTMVAVCLPVAVLDLSIDPQYAIAVAGFVMCGAVMHSLRTPSIQLLYAPIEPQQRMRALSLGEGAVEPLGIGAAAIVLLVLTRVLDDGVHAVAAGVVVSAGALAVVSFMAFGGYRRALDIALGLPRLRRSAFDLLDDVTARRLTQQAVTGDAPQALAVLAVFEEARADQGELLNRLVGHPSGDIRAIAVTRLQELAHPISVDIDMLADDPEPTVRAAAVRFAAHRAGGSVVQRALEDADTGIRASALAGMLEAPLGGTRDAGRRILAEWVASADPDQRVAAARAEGITKDRSDPAHIVQLLSDPHPAVRREALLAAGSAREPRALRTLVGSLQDRTLHVSAVDALVAFGTGCIGAVTSRLDDPERIVRRNVVNILRRLDDPQATEALVGALAHPDRSIRSRAASALAAREHSLDPAALTSLVRPEALIVTRASDALVAIGSAPESARGAARVLELSVRELLDDSRDFVLRMIELADSTFARKPVERGLASGDHRQRAYALEAIDTAMPAALKPHAHAVIGQRYPELALGTGAGEWQRGSASTAAAVDALVRVLDQGSTGWIAQLASHLFVKEAAPIRRRQAGTGIDSIDVKGDRTAMAETIERVLFLKGVEPFSKVPTEALGSLAFLLREVYLHEGEELFAKGDAGTSMYLVVSGSLRVHDGPVGLATLRRHAMFGELALLDAEPRSASVTAITEAMLYELEQDVFFELVGDRPEVLRGILATVTATLRKRSNELAELHRQLGPTMG